MNSRGVYRPPPTSRASATTLCQKCLKKGHFSYECKASSQDRPYIARPSRTQQLQNPKLAPKLSMDVPDDLLQRKGVTDAVLAKSAAARGRKRSMSVEDGPRKRSRSVSSFSSSSISTISTSDSRSASAPRRRETSPMDQLTTSQYQNGDTEGTSSFERKRRRRRSSASSHGTHGRHNSDRNTRRRRSEFSPDERGRKSSRLRDEERRSRSKSRDRQHEKRRSSAHSRAEGRPGTARNGARSPSPYRHTSGNKNGHAPPRHAAPPRPRSLSPYSKRLALTQTMNPGR